MMSILLNDIKHCEECNCETNELYLTHDNQILCVDCEADYTIEMIKLNGYDLDEEKI